MAMLAVFVGGINAAVESFLMAKPNLDDILAARVRREILAVRALVAGEFMVSPDEIVMPNVYRGINELVIDLTDEQKRAWNHMVPAPITAADASKWIPDRSADEERARLYSLAYNCGVMRSAIMALMEVWMEANPAACGSSPDEEDQG